MGTAGNDAVSKTKGGDDISGTMQAPRALAALLGMTYGGAPETAPSGAQRFAASLMPPKSVTSENSLASSAKEVAGGPLHTVTC